MPNMPIFVRVRLASYPVFNCGKNNNTIVSRLVREFTARMIWKFHHQSRKSNNSKALKNKDVYV